MAQTNPAEIRISQLTQVGIVVKDVEKVAQEYWNILGVGPWNIVTLSPPQFRDQVYRGKPTSYVGKFGFAQMGQVELELLQPLQGHTVYDDFLAEHGEGAHHLQYLVDSADEVYRRNEIMTKKGFSVIQGGRVGDNGAFAYYNTEGPLKTIWELVKNPDEYIGLTTKYPPAKSAVSPAKIKAKEIYQVSLAVKNVEETMGNYWNLFGIGPWDILNCVPPNWYDTTYYGQPAKLTTRVGLTMLGSVEFELIQPVDGDSLQRDHIRKYGAGINHLAFAVDDVEETVRLMEAEGFPCVQYGRVLPDGAYAYFDTVGPLKVYWEAFKAPSTGIPVSARYPQ